VFWEHDRRYRGHRHAVISVVGGCLWRAGGATAVAGGHDPQWLKLSHVRRQWHGGICEPRHKEPGARLGRTPGSSIQTNYLLSKPLAGDLYAVLENRDFQQARRLLRRSLGGSWHGGGAGSRRHGGSAGWWRQARRRCLRQAELPKWTAPCSVQVQQIRRYGRCKHSGQERRLAIGRRTKLDGSSSWDISCLGGWRFSSSIACAPFRNSDQ